jgi:hypothetical protein
MEMELNFTNLSQMQLKALVSKISQISNFWGVLLCHFSFGIPLFWKQVGMEYYAFQFTLLPIPLSFQRCNI